MLTYLDRLTGRFDEINTEVSGVLTLAQAENRSLTDAELGTLSERATESETLAGQIRSLRAHDQRVAAVAGVPRPTPSPEQPAAGANGESTEGDHTRGAQPLGTTAATSNTEATDRSPGHYRSVREGGEHSFFGDLHHARQGNTEAAQRLADHQRHSVAQNRALTMTGEGPGVTPPIWMQSEFTELARQQRRAANVVRNLTITTPAPMSLPRQTSGDGSGYNSGNAQEVRNQTGSPSENAAISSTEVWDSGVDTVTPATVSGSQTVSRQMLDASNPAIDALIYSDLISSYNMVVERKVVAAMVAAAGTALATYANEAAWDAALNDPENAAYIPDELLDTAIAVRAARKLPADVLITSVTRYGSLLKMKDATSRPLIGGDAGQSVNIIGSGTVPADGRFTTAGLSVIATDGASGYPESVLVARASDTILFESPTMRFRYEEVSGPQSIRLGVWAYVATYVKYATQGSVKRLVVTAAT